MRWGRELDGVGIGGGNDGVTGHSGGLWGGGWVAAVEVEGEEAFKDGGGVEVGVGVGQPGGALVVEVGQRASSQVFGGQSRVAVGVGGVEPAFAQFVEAGGGLGDGLALGVGLREGKVSKQVVGV